MNIYMYIIMIVFKSEMYFINSKLKKNIFNKM